MNVGRAEWLAACALACRQDAEQLRAVAGGRDDPSARMVRVAADAIEVRGREYEQAWRLGERGPGLPAPGPSLAEPPPDARGIDFVGGPRDGLHGPLPATCSCGKPIHNGSLLQTDGAVYVVDVDTHRARHVPPEFLGEHAA